MAPTRDTPTRPVGVPGGVTAQAGWLDTWEQTAELRWPHSILVYDKMRTDFMCRAIFQAVTLPIRKAHVSLAGDDVPDHVMAAVACDLGIPYGPRTRRARTGPGVRWRRANYDSLLCLRYGFMPAEKWVEPGPPGPDLAAYAAQLPAVYGHLRLAPRTPRTIVGWDLDAQGNLARIYQQVRKQNGDWDEVPIERDRLALFVNDEEGGDPTGNSIYRAAYPHWFLKRDIMRIDAQAAERNGMGVPVVGYPADGDRSEALRIARGFRAGDESSVARPAGYTLDLVTAGAGARDLMPSLKYHDQAIAMSALAMFLTLGHDAGARSLGDSFIEFFLLALGALTDMLEDTWNTDVIGPQVAYNFGDDMPVPALEISEPTSDLTAEALSSLVAAHIITADDALEEDVRRRYGLPEYQPTPGEADQRTTVPYPPPAPDAPPTVPPGAPDAPPAPPVPVAATHGGGRRAATARSAADVARRAADVAERMAALTTR